MKNNDFAEIVAGICRSDSNYYNYEQLNDIKEEFDVIVDFSHKDSFDKILSYAIKKNKPLIIGTAGLTEEQMKAFEIQILYQYLEAEILDLKLKVLLMQL